MYTGRENRSNNALKKKTHALVINLLHHTKSESRVANTAWKKELSKTTEAVKYQEQNYPLEYSVRRQSHTSTFDLPFIRKTTTGNRCFKQGRSYIL